MDTTLAYAPLLTYRTFPLPPGGSLFLADTLLRAVPAGRHTLQCLQTPGSNWWPTRSTRVFRSWLLRAAGRGVYFHSLRRATRPGVTGGEMVSHQNSR